MKRRTFFKACAGALAGVVGWAMKPEQTDGIFTEDDYKSLSSDYTIGDADNSCTISYYVCRADGSIIEIGLSEIMNTTEDVHEVIWGNPVQLI